MNFPLRRIMFGALTVAAIWIIAVILGWIFQPEAFYRAYLHSWLLWLGVALGSLAVVMLHHMTGGEWGITIRRLGEHAAMTLPLLIVLFIPIVIGMHSLYPWDRADALALSAKLRHKVPYLNVTFFLCRAVIYAAIWTFLAWYLRSRSLRYDRNPNPITRRRMHNLSAGGMLAYFITMSLASVDWIMSLEPEWFSTIFGFIIIMGQVLSGLAVLIVLFSLMRNSPPFRDIVRPNLFNDLGNLLLTFVILWTYMAFAQLLVTWMANKQDEIPWYVQRLSNGWGGIALLLVILHFLVPFIMLLMRELKRKAPAMLALCAGLLIMRSIDLFWNVAPSGEDPMPLLSHLLTWMDFVFPIGMGALWLALFCWLADGHPLIIEGDAVPVPEELGNV